MDESGVCVFKPGAAIVVGGDIEATIMAVRIGLGSGIMYLVAWWESRTRHEIWVTPQEVSERARPDDVLPVGFRGPA
jgi:hypothetical protein